MLYKNTPRNYPLIYILSALCTRSTAHRTADNNNTIVGNIVGNTVVSIISSVGPILHTTSIAFLSHACPLHTNRSGCGKIEAHINWSMVKPEKAAPVTGTTSRTASPGRRTLGSEHHRYAIAW